MSTPKKPTFQKRLFAWMLMKSDAINHVIYDSFKKNLFQHLNGLVVEIGPGTGVNFDYLSYGTEWIGIEPNEALHETLLARAAKNGIKAKLISTNSSHIPLQENSADFFLCTLVLCSVKNPTETISEIKRILKPKGKLIIIEHVASTTQKGLFLAQNIFNPVMRIVADGCNCNRKTWTYIQEGGFSEVQLNHYDLKGPLIFHKPHIIGYAVK